MADEHHDSGIAPGPLPLHININPEGLRHALTFGLTVNYQRVALVLNLSAHASRELVELEGVPMRLSWAEHDRPSDAWIQEDLRNWVLSCGFRDGVETVGHFLDEADRVFAYLEISQQALITPDELRAMEKARAKFHRGGLGDKLDALQKSAGVTIPSALRRWIESLNAARNCFVHRGGRVGTQDVDTNGKMRVEWQRLRLALLTAGGEKELVGSVTKEGDSPVLKVEPASKEFALGDRLIFTAEEYSQVVFTLTRVAEPVMQTLVAKLKAAGLVAEDGTLLSRKPSAGDAS